MLLPPQQEQPAPCLLFISDKVVGAWALRSFVASAVRRRGSIVVKFGAVSSTRSAPTSQTGHGVKPIVPEELIARIRVHLGNARMTHSARAALDVFGRFLLAIDRSGRVLWCTPQAAKLLRRALRDFETESYTVPQSVQEWLQRCAQNPVLNTSETVDLPVDVSSIGLTLSYIGQVGENEFLLRLAEAELGSEEQVIKAKLALTQRESEVLLWISRGKSNRDVAEILSLSPRTVNKHLEQIYAKLGVENRTSAATLAMRALGLG
jgi:DNA-binding CsgD family transcriptional regulator